MRCLPNADLRVGGLKYLWDIAIVLQLTVRYKEYRTEETKNSMHGPTQYNEKSLLIKKKRENRDDRKNRDPNTHKGGKSAWSNIFKTLCCLSAPAALACGVIFAFVLLITAVSRWGGPQPPPYVRKIAIIGAGPAGSSAAYNVRRFSQQKGILVDITVYEKNDYVGGRSTCKVQVDDQNVQIAARGFHASNKNLVDTVNELKLTPVMLDGKVDTDLTGRSGDRWGVYDGSAFVYRQAHPSNILSSWWLSIKLFYFYGYSPSYAHTLITKTASKFRRIYSPRFFPFTSLTSVVKDLELEEETSLTSRQLLSKNKIGIPFQKDLVSSWTRREFGQNLGQISGLAMTMAPDDGDDMTVEGGHWVLFEEMMRRSQADIMLNTTVLGLRKMDWGGWVVASQRQTEDDDLDYQDFDTVILAAPYQFAGLEIKGDRLDYVPDELEYASVHVTLFKSRRKLSPAYFRLKGEVPETVLTTLGSDEMEALTGRTGAEGVGRVGFYSVTSVKRVPRLIQGIIVEEFLYKIVSPERMEEKMLHEILGANEEEEDIVSWIYRHEFPSAYPYIYPRTSFAGLVLEENFWYTAGIEELSSSLEMSSMMGWNVAKLVVDEWMSEGKRGKRPPPPEEQSHEGESGEEMPKMAFEDYLKGKYEGII